MKCIYSDTNRFSMGYMNCIIYECEIVKYKSGYFVNVVHRMLVILILINCRRCIDV